MRNRSLFQVIFMVGLFTLSSLAVAVEKRFGVVDMQRVILSVEEGKTARKNLESEIKSTEKELMKEKQELDQMNQQWKKQSALLTEQAKADKQRQFQEKFLALRKKEMEFQQKIKGREQEETQKIFVKVAKMVDTMARNKKLQAVFETNSAGLLYLENPLDLTSEVIEKYNKENKSESKSAKK